LIHFFKESCAVFSSKMVVRDRLKEMQEASRHYTDGVCDVDIEMKPLTKGQDFEAFLLIAEEINLGIDTVKKNVDEMKTTQKRILTEPSRAEREKYQAKHSDYVEMNKSMGGKIQKLIKGEQEKMVALEKKGKMSSKELAEFRLKKTQIQTASNRFLEIWTEYNTLQVEFREKVKKELAKTVRITNNTLSQEEIEEKIDKGDVTVFSSSIIQETAAAKDQLVALENRHQEMLKLERGIVEIHSMFVDLANLVEMQGEMVNRIEDHIMAASADVERGRDDLGKAENLQKSARKKKFILGIILAVVLFILLLVLLYEFGAFSGSSGGGQVETNYYYVMPDGTKKKMDKPPDLTNIVDTQVSEVSDEGSGLALDEESWDDSSLKETTP